MNVQAWYGSPSSAPSYDSDDTDQCVAMSQDDYSTKISVVEMVPGSLSFVCRMAAYLVPEVLSCISQFQVFHDESNFYMRTTQYNTACDEIFQQSNEEYSSEATACGTVEGKWGPLQAPWIRSTAVCTTAPCFYPSCRQCGLGPVSHWVQRPLPLHSPAQGGRPRYYFQRLPQHAPIILHCNLPVTRSSALHALSGYVTRASAKSAPCSLAQGDLRVIRAGRQHALHGGVLEYRR